MPSLKKGFTLIEIIVAVAIFSIVMMIAISAVLSAVDANRKAQSLNVVVNNLNLAVESMVRDIRTGYDYQDCGSGCISFKDRDGYDVTYNYVNSVSSGDSYLDKETDPARGEGRITSDEVTLEDVAFEIQGPGSNDGPERVLLHIKGYAGMNKTKSEFNIQTLISSRFLDIND